MASDIVQLLRSGANIANDYLGKNTGAVLAGAGGVLAGTAIGVGIAGAGKSKSPKSASRPKKKKAHATRKKSSKRRKNFKYPRTAGKGKDRSSKRIRMTKNGQPYVIMASGKARFISKASARNSRRKKGGRY